MVERSVDPSFIQVFGGRLVGRSAMWSGLSICRSVAMAFDQLLGCWLVGCLLPCLLGGMVGSFVF